MEKIRSRKKLALFGCSGLGVNMLNAIMTSYLCSALMTGGFIKDVENWTYLNKTLVVAGIWAILRFFAKALDGLIDLPLSTLADSLNTKLGRRKTAILIGFVPMIISYLLFMVPLQNEETILNTIWFGLLLCSFYVFYTLTMLTYYASFAEVCDGEADLLFLSNCKSVCDVIYNSLSFALVPLFVGFGMNIRILALIFLPLSLTMLIPFFLLKENRNSDREVRTLTLGQSLSTAFKIKGYIYWMLTSSVTAIGLQLFLGGINEVFSTIGLNMTVVMASSFAPVPLTILLYNFFVKKKGLGFAYRYVLTIFSIGMLVMYLCYVCSSFLDGLGLTLIALFGGIFVSFAIGAFFSVTYTVPSLFAELEYQKTGKGVSGMLFAVQGLFEGVAAGIATGPILTMLKDLEIVSILPLIVMGVCAVSFIMTFKFKPELAYMGKKDNVK